MKDNERDWEIKINKKIRMSDRGKERGQMEKDKSWEIEKDKMEEGIANHKRKRRDRKA